jgi:GNAT superfamily N-acetyltransferase
VADPLLIRHALPGERPALEALQLRASLIWEDYRENLAADPAVVRLTDDAIEEQRVRVAVVGVRAVGFSELVVVSGAEWELEGLFVEPDAMRRGIGGRLLGDFFDRARDCGVQRVAVIAEPHAAVFYKRNGFVREGDVQTRFGPALRMAADVALIGGAANEADDPVPVGIVEPRTRSSNGTGFRREGVRRDEDRHHVLAGWGVPTSAQLVDTHGREAIAAGTQDAGPAAGS